MRAARRRDIEGDRNFYPRNPILLSILSHNNLIYPGFDFWIDYTPPSEVLREVKPYVDGSVTTLRSLIAAAITKFGLRERRLDAARCRRVMIAYMICAAKGETATADRLQLWEREHSKHRDVHLGELAALQQTAGLTVTAKEAKIVAKMKAQQDMQKKTEAKKGAFEKKLISKRKRFYNRRAAAAASDAKKAVAKANRAKYLARVAAGLVHYESGAVRARKKL